MKLSFVVTLAGESVDQVRGCLAPLRAAYPGAPVTVITDGIEDPGYPGLAREFRAEYVAGRYLKRTECGGMWWDRFLRAGLRSSPDWIVKLDPDAVIHRPFRGTPPADVSGTLKQRGTAKENIQGGCQFISAGAGRKILASGLLTGDALRNSAVYCPELAWRRSWIPTGYMSSDYSLMHVCRKLSISWADWSEIGSNWKTPPAGPNGYAVTHPHYFGPRSANAGIPSTTPLRVITTCKGRLSHLTQTLPIWLVEPGVEVTVVDYSCQDGTAAWVAANHPQVRIAKLDRRRVFNLAWARNVGAAATPEGWWCFFDADLRLKPGWADAVRAAIKPGHYHVAAPMATWGLCGSAIVHSDDFRLAGGYDELFAGWGQEDSDLYMRLRQVGVRPANWPGEYAQTIAHDDAARAANYDLPKTLSKPVADEYLRRKRDLMVATGKLPTLSERKSLMAAARTEYDLPYGDDDERLMGDAVPAGDVESTSGEGNSTAADRVAVTEAPSGQTVSRATAPLPIRTGIQTTPKPRSQGVNISVINESSLHLGLTLEQLCDVGDNYLRQILEPIWPGTLATLIPTTVILPHTQAIVLMDDPGHNDTLGYRSRTPDGLPLVHVYVRPTLTAGKSITAVFTQQLAALRIDPDLNRHATAADGTVYAYEPTDPVDEDSFLLDGVPVANVVTPAWFQQTGRPKFDYMGRVVGPFTLTPGGSALVRDGEGWKTVHGSFPKSERPAMHHPSHRTAVRTANHAAAGQKMHRAYLTK